MLTEISNEQMQGIEEFAQMLKNWADLEGEHYFKERIEAALDYYKELFNNYAKRQEKYFKEGDKKC